MGSYGVITEALLVKYNEPAGDYSIVQKLVPATVNGMVMFDGDGGFKFAGRDKYVNTIYHGGAFGFSERSGGKVEVSVNIPGSGANMFTGMARVDNVNGVGQGVLCTPTVPVPYTPYTHLCLVVESPGSVFAEN